MKPVPQARQPSAPGARLVRGRLLNEIAEAIQARTPLNAQTSTAQGYSGAAKEGGTKPKQEGRPLRFDANRTYVVSPALLARLNAALRARTTADGVTRGAPVDATAGGIEALLRAINWVSPDAAESTTPDGYRLPVGGRTASLRIELETKTAYADMCAIDVNLPDEYITKQTTVQTFANGTTTSTATASAVIRTWESGALPTDCAAIVYEDDFDPGFDYGAFISSDYTEEYKPFTDVYSAALAALAGLSPASSHLDYSWAESEWRSTTVGAWTVPLGGVGVEQGGVAPPAAGKTMRWRVVNTGQAWLRVSWRHTLPGGSMVTSGTVTVARGQTSAWQEPPAPSADPAALITVTLFAIAIGPYR